MTKPEFPFTLPVGNTDAKHGIASVAHATNNPILFRSEAIRKLNQALESLAAMSATESADNAMYYRAQAQGMILYAAQAGVLTGVLDSRATLDWYGSCVNYYRKLEAAS